MSKRSVHVFKLIDEIAAFFADKLMKEMAALKAGKIFSLMLSGGSTPKAVFEFLSRNPENIQWNHLQLFWGDERCVPPDQDESNFKMTKNSLLDRVPIPPENIFRIRGEADPFDEAKRYSELVYSKVPHQNQVPRFDLVLLGLGEDGHTASLFPNDKKNLISRRLFEVASHPISGQRRITSTLELINNAKTIVFLVTGSSKAAMLATIVEKKKGWEQFPASLVEAHNGKLFWLADEAAASELKI